MSGFIDILMWVVTVCTYISYIPQIIKLVKTKRSEGISVLSWILWVTSALCSSIWSVYMGNFSLIVASASEFLLNLIILCLSIKYQKVNVLNLCGVEVIFREEWLLLNTIINSLDTSDDKVREIVKGCNIPIVLENVVHSKNTRISKSTRMKALSKLTDITGNIDELLSE